MPLALRVGDSLHLHEEMDALQNGEEKPTGTSCIQLKSDSGSTASFSSGASESTSTDLHEKSSQEPVGGMKDREGEDRRNVSEELRNSEGSSQQEQMFKTPDSQRGKKRRDQGLNPFQEEVLRLFTDAKRRIMFDFDPEEAFAISVLSSLRRIPKKRQFETKMNVLTMMHAAEAEE